MDFASDLLSSWDSLERNISLPGVASKRVLDMEKACDALLSCCVARAVPVELISYMRPLISMKRTMINNKILEILTHKGKFPIEFIDIHC